MDIISHIEQNPDVLHNRQALRILFLEHFDIKAKSNLLMMAYDAGILDLLGECRLSDDKKLEFCDTLCTDFCIPIEKATYAVNVWERIVFATKGLLNHTENETIIQENPKETTCQGNVPALPLKHRADWISEYKDAVVIFGGKEEYGAFNNDGLVLNYLLNCKQGSKGKDTFSTFPYLKPIEDVLSQNKIDYVLIISGQKKDEKFFEDNQYGLFLQKALNNHPQKSEEDELRELILELAKKSKSLAHLQTKLEHVGYKLEDQGIRDYWVLVTKSNQKISLFRFGEQFSKKQLQQLIEGKTVPRNFIPSDSQINEEITFIKSVISDAIKNCFTLKEFNIYLNNKGLYYHEDEMLDYWVVDNRNTGIRTNLCRLGEKYQRNQILTELLTTRAYLPDPSRKEVFNHQTILSPKDQAILEARERIESGDYSRVTHVQCSHTCTDCMLYRNETCFGSKTICEDFKFAPTIPKEETDLWPKIGDATYYRLGGRCRG